MSSVKDTGPLDWRIAIVDKSGRPTQEFQRRWATQRANNALIGSVTFGTGTPTGSPDDGAEYVDTTKDPWVLYIGENSIWNIVGVQEFIDLGDVPGNYTGSAGKLVRVNGNTTGLEFDSASVVLDSFGNSTGGILTRGNSTWGVLGPGTSGFVLTSAGPSASPTWAAGGGGGGGGGAMVDGNPVILPSLSSLTWRNQGGATAVQHTGGPITITAPTSGNFAVRGLEITSIPGTTPWTLTAKMSGLMWNNQYNILGVYIADATGRLVSTEMLYGGPIIQFSNWNSATSFGGTITTTPIVARPAVWLRIMNDGTNFIFSVSENGADWIQLTTQGVGAWLGTPTAGGAYVHNSGDNLSQNNTGSIWSLELVSGSGTNSSW